MAPSRRTDPKKLNAVLAAFAETGDKTYAAQKGGMSPGNVAYLVAKPENQAEIMRIQSARLFNDILPLAVAVHHDVLTNPATPAAARVQAVKLAYEYTLGQKETAGAKEPHEMSPAELQAELARLQHAAARATAELIEAGPAPIDEPSAEPDDASIFD